MITIFFIPYYLFFALRKKNTLSFLIFRPPYQPTSFSFLAFHGSQWFLRVLHKVASAKKNLPTNKKSYTKPPATVEVGFFFRK